MCGRYVLVSKLKVIEREFQVDIADILDRFQVNPNVCPGQSAVVITNSAPKQAQMSIFGFTPHWAKKRMYVINARSETVVSKPMFRKSIRSQRCLIIADAFIEGTTKEKLSKPYLVYNSTSKRPLALAGIWDQWTDPLTSEVVHSFAILTTAPTPLMEAIPHHRSPLVLTQNQEKSWINSDTPLTDVMSMLHPFDDTGFNAYPISPAVKSPKNHEPQLLKPLGDPLRKSYDYVFYQDLDLQGMGETTARKRKQNDQLDIFDTTS